MSDLNRQPRPNRFFSGTALILLTLALLSCRPTSPPLTATPPSPSPPPPPPATATVPTPTPLPSLPPPTTAQATATPTLTPTPVVTQVQVYFTDLQRYAAATEPYEVAVTRTVVITTSLPEAVLREFFKGPTEEEQARGLAAITSGFTGLDRLVIEAGVAHVYLRGACSSGGATYTIAQPLRVNLTQFDEIKYVKIYDQNGETEEPEGAGDSIPFCLEP